MILKQINENQNWITMNWECAFLMKWGHILHGIRAISPTFKEVEVVAGAMGAQPKVINPTEKPDEQPMVQMRGYSNFFKGKVSLLFNTGTNTLRLTIPRNLNLTSDYQNLAIAVGPFMDSLELRMYSGK